MKLKISKGKYERLKTCADERGIIAALAVDHRQNLLHAIASARGSEATSDDLSTFKTTVANVLAPYASALLLDPDHNLRFKSEHEYSPSIMLAYEQSSYDHGAGDRLPDLLPEWSVRRLVEAGAQAIKILLYYNPFDAGRVNVIKQVYVERIGAECAALEVPFFLEPLVYDKTIGDAQGLAFARRKPDYVARTMDEFSRPRYGVDILKVELPINPAFVADTRAFNGTQAAYTRQEALTLLRETARVTSLPFIYLSAGASNEVFCEMLELAAEAGAQFAGVLCGRATWQQGIQIYARQGVQALEDWLTVHGTNNIQSINRVLSTSAVPWWQSYDLSA
ncbi:tagatose 1,6-diphosphate aldolase [Ktedonospora formicarum]|uniref:tagatose-bisphosphate aldolase n=1 Tax=Ktedonospora formicarum TaxID=2778364 RepID=A0A8J3HZN3_9CHLR|nr:tagatose 1,6-diphosphate aldolase [Ktedonospora formicarum]GHO46116.1 tagatose 1,6-diphosphate aldolase [Ktedonospora formicarum]